MPINESDRHVLALAVQVGAPTIVTENLRDLPARLLAPHGVEAVSPDAFTLARVDLHLDGVIVAGSGRDAAERVRPLRRAVSSLPAGDIEVAF